MCRTSSVLSYRSIFALPCAPGGWQIWVTSTCNFIFWFLVGFSQFGKPPGDRERRRAKSCYSFPQFPPLGSTNSLSPESQHLLGALSLGNRHPLLQVSASLVFSSCHVHTFISSFFTTNSPPTTHFLSCLDPDKYMKGRKRRSRI